MESRIHISLEVLDLKSSIDFYSRLFQQEPTKAHNDYANFRLEEPQLHLALVHNPSRNPEAHSSRHYGVELFSDKKLDALQALIQESGIKTRSEQSKTCCYAVANKFWARDPDGHEWEFWVRHSEADTMSSDDSAACGNKQSECCAPKSEKQVLKKSCCS